jgi:hypothetical protein
LQSTVGERGGCLLYSTEDLLNENVNYTHIIIESSLKMAFLMNTSETKKFAKIFLEAFFILKKIFCFNHPELISVSLAKGLLIHKQRGLGLKVKNALLVDKRCMIV